MRQAGPAVLNLKEHHALKIVSEIGVFQECQEQRECFRSDAPGTWREKQVRKALPCCAYLTKFKVESRALSVEDWAVTKEMFYILGNLACLTVWAVHAFDAVKPRGRKS